MMITTLLMSGMLFAAAPTPSAPADLQKMSREEFMKLPIEERRARTAEIMQRRLGGTIVKEGSAKGYVRVVSSQKRVPLKELERPISEISKFSRVRYAMLEGDAVTVETALAARQRLGDGIVVFVVDNPTYPALLPAPEEGWAIVNVARLAADNPDPDKLARRLRKECSRAYAFVAGAANVLQHGAALNPVASVKDIDALPGDLLPREAVIRFEPQLKLFGVEPYVKASYRTACEKGWAPAPTNKYQQAIWDEVHAAPTKPIVIKPETKKQ